MANLLGSDTRIVGTLEIESVAGTAVPPSISGVTGVMDTSGRTNGSIHMRTDSNELSEILMNSAATKIGLGQHAIECRLPTPLTANGTTIYRTHVPRSMKIVGISRTYATVPASTSGTVLVSVTGAGNQLLSSSTESEEGLTNDSLTNHVLTATSADLLLTKGATLLITITSNNADMTGGATGQYHIYYEDNV